MAANDETEYTKRLYHALGEYEAAIIDAHADLYMNPNELPEEYYDFVDTINEDFDKDARCFDNGLSLYLIDHVLEGKA